MPREKQDARAAKGGFPPTPPRRLGNQEAAGQAILITTAHRPIAALRQMQR
jgi:hypothetical protein